MHYAVEFGCGHTTERWNPVRKDEIPAYLARAKDRLCPNCKARQDRVEARRNGRRGVHRDQIRKLEVIANCVRVARGDGLTPVEQRYVRMLVAKLDRQDADLFGA
jgi:hypothetical protein